MIYSASNTSCDSSTYTEVDIIVVTSYEYKVPAENILIAGQSVSLLP